MTVPRVKFWFLRHGQTDYNARGLSQGSVDIPLNETGRAQARAAAALLAGRGIAGIVSSPMSRARETAEIVNETLRLPLDFDHDLREVAFGGMEGRKLHPWFDEWLAGRVQPDGAESFAAITSRAEHALGRVLTAPGPLLVVSHGTFFRALRAAMGVAFDTPTPNAVPILCEPANRGWQIMPMVGEPV
ncbi:MAG: histidine phosphatase family protein [Acidiphilium sp.]